MPDDRLDEASGKSSDGEGGDPPGVPAPSTASNAVLSATSWAIPAVASLVSVPILVRGLGADQYGVLVLATAVTGYLGIMEMGLGQAVVRSVAHYQALNNGRTVRAVIRAVNLWLLLAGSLVACAMFALAPWLADELLHVPEDLQSLAVTVLRITSVNFALGMLVSVTSAVPQGFLRYDLVARMGTTFGTVAAAGPAVLVAIGFGLEAVVLFGLALSSVALAVWTYLSSRLVASLDAESGPDWRSVRRGVLSFAGVTALTRMHSIVAAQTSRLVVGAAEGVASAAYYQVPNQLSTQATAPLSRMANVLFPTAARLLAIGDESATHALYIRASRLLFLLSASVTAGLCALAYPLIEYWVSPQFAAQGAAALVVFSLSAMVNASTMSASYINLAHGRPGVNLVFSLVNSVVTLVSVIPLTTHFGVVGAAAAGLLGTVNVPLFFAYSHRKVIRVASWTVFRQAYFPSLMASCLVGAVARLVVAPLCHGLFWTLVWLVIVGAAALCLSAVLGAAHAEDWAAARRLSSSVLGRFRNGSRNA